jgi:site-specific recombinase XerD
MRSTLTFQEAVSSFLMDVKLTKREGTYRFYAYYLSRMQAMLASHRLDAITPRLMTEFMYQLKQSHPTMKAATVNKFITCFKACFRFHMPYPFRYRKLKEEHVHIPYVEPTTITTIFSYYQQHLENPRLVRNFLMYAMLLDTGLRINELLHVQWEDINLTQRSLTVMHSKDHHQRFLFFTTFTLHLLDLLRGFVSPQGYIFIDLHTHQRLCVSSIETITQRLMKTLHLEKSISPHKWRHTFATRFLTQGGNLEVLRILLGHHNLRITQKYLHVTHTQLQHEYRRIMDAASHHESPIRHDTRHPSLKEE